MKFAPYSRLASNVWTAVRAGLIAIAVGLLLSSGSPAIAQSIFANLSGTVVDANGAVIPDAEVSVQNAGTNVVRKVVTNKVGYFSATELLVGTYKVTVEAKGFQKWEATGIVLQGADDKTLNIPLKVGSESETITVNAGTDEVAVTDTGARADHIDTEKLEHLAMVGRNAMEILKILPGAAQISNGGTNRPGYTGETVGINGFTVNGNAGGMSGVSINGQTATGLSINQDGQNVEDPGAPGNATPVNPNPDMISEVSILTSNYGAENAKGPVVINSLSKSGGSTFHGDVHFYARNSAMNSEDAFSKAVEADPTSGYKKGQLKVPSHYYYPGFDVGGPILVPGTEFNKSRNKYFFHESFENYRQLIDGGINRAFVPTGAMVNNGDFSGMSSWTNSPGRFGMSSQPSGTLSARPGCSIIGGVMSAACISAAAQLWMKDSMPLPTSPNGAPDSHGFNYVQPVQESQNSTHNMVKIDTNFTENTKAYISWSRQRETANEPLGLWQGSGDWVIPSPSQDISNNTSDLYTANLLHIFSPTLTVEARFGYTHMDMPGQPKSPNKVLRSQMNFPIKGVFANQNAPVVTSWGQSVPNIGDIGHDYHPNFYAEKANTSSGADLTKVYKTHTAKFGFNWEHKYNAQDAWSQYMGVYTYNPWGGGTGNNYADILAGVNFSYFEQAMPPAIKMVLDESSFYATDHWKLNRRITVDYGLRFEHWGAGYPDDPYGDAVFDKNRYQSGVKNSGISWHSLDHSISKAGQSVDFMVYSPRFGATIDLYGNGKSILRGGWGQYRYGNYVVSNQSAANTAIGSIGWNAPGSATTWESVDNYINTGGGPNSCTAGSNCAPKVVWGAVTDFTNGNLYLVDPHNHDQPYTTTYSLTVDQQFPGKFLFEIGYVGNHSDLGQNNVNLNSVPIGAMTASSVSTACKGMDGDVLTKQLTDGNCQQLFRPYQTYQGVNLNESSAKSEYNSFQTSLTRSAGWATVSLNYGWAKNMGTTNQSGAFKDYGTKEYWSPLKIDRAHTFNAAYVFDLPKVGGRSRLLRGAANGWEFSGITQVMSGDLLTDNSGYQLGISNAQSGALLVGSPDVTVAPILTCDPRQGLKSHQFANPSCFAQPETGTQGIGNTRFPYLVGPMYWNSDATLLKAFTITERQKVEFRFAAFNFMNHDLLSFAPGDNNAKLNFDSNGKLTNANDTKDACPGPTCQAFGFADYHYGRRVLEVSAKYTF